jgi:hypothetical protein
VSNHPPNEDTSALNGSARGFDEDGLDEFAYGRAVSRHIINRYGQVVTDYDEQRRKHGTSECSHDTPEPIEDVSIVFEHVDDRNKPLEVDLSDSSAGSENDIVYYHKEDMTNFSKNLGLNIVKQRELPEIGVLGSSTPGSRRKKK